MDVIRLASRWTARIVCWGLPVRDVEAQFIRRMVWDNDDRKDHKPSPFADRNWKKAVAFGAKTEAFYGRENGATRARRMAKHSGGSLIGDTIR